MSTGSLAKWLEFSPMAQVKAYQKLKKIVLGTSLLNTQHYKGHIKDKVEQSRERSSNLANILV